MPNSTHEPPRNLKELFSFRLNMLAHMSSRLAAETNLRDFDLDPRDWRIVALLASFAPMSLQGLAREVNVDKSQASRSVAGLIQRGLLQRESDESDGRGVQLSLTPVGKALYRKVFPKAVKRNEELLSVLTDEERQVLERALDRLIDSAQGKLQSTRKRRESSKSV